jgi:3-hydroxyisobutyrate dehydrogenase-like beta-hydroxyacid dehydrogenase
MKALGNGITNIKANSILNDNYASFPLKHLVKDLRLAKEAGLDSPLTIHCMIVMKQLKRKRARKM